MKSRIYIITLIIALLTLGCETKINTVSSTQFYKLYGTFHNDHMHSVYPLNGGWLISGSYEDEADSSWAYVIKTLPNGMKEWDTAFNGNVNARAYDALSTVISDEHKILVAVAKELPEDTCYLSVAQLNLDGSEVLTIDSLIHASGFNNLKIRKLDNGTVRLFSQIYKVAENSTDVVSYIFVHDFTTDSGLVERVSHEIEEVVVGNIVVETKENTSYLGYTFKENNTGLTDVRLMCIIGNSITWNRAFGDKNSSESCSDIIIEDQGIILTGNYIDNNSTQIYLLNASFNGDQNASSTIQIDDVTEQFEIGSFTLNKSDNFVFTGKITTGVERSDIFFLETTRAGENIDDIISFGTGAKKPGSSTGLIIKYIEQNDGYILAGELEPVNNTDICLFSLDSKGSWVSGD
jgi:hypothetical protein